MKWLFVFYIIKQPICKINKIIVSFNHTGVQNALKNQILSIKFYRNLGKTRQNASEILVFYHTFLSYVFLQNFACTSNKKPVQ